MARPTETSLIQSSLSSEEAIILQSLVHADKPANEVIPDDISAQDLWKNLAVACKALGKAQEAVTRLKPFIGRFLMLLRSHPHLYEQYEYSNYNDFMTNGVPKLFGISRPEAYNCVKVAETLGFMDPHQMSSMGFASLNVLASGIRRAVHPGMSQEAIEQKREELVTVAKNSTVKELKEHIENIGLAERGEFDKTSLVIMVNPLVKETWDDAVQSPEIRAYCGSDDPGVIFDRMVNESLGEWQARSMDAERAAIDAQAV